MRRRVFLLTLFLFVPLASRASWTWLNSPQYIRTADFYNAHLGLVAFGQLNGPLMRMSDGVFSGVYDVAIQQVKIQDSNSAWASDNINIYHGTANWSIWTQTIIAVSAPRLIATTPQGLFFHGDSTLYFTSDGSTIVTTVGIPHNDSIASIDYLTSAILIAASPKGIYRSSDAGATWTRVIGAPLTNSASVFADRSRGIVFVGGDNLRKSTDNGLTWKIVPPAPQFNLLAIDGEVYGAHDCSGAFYVTGSNILRSEDGGNTFVEVLPYALGNHFLLVKGWAFDRGATVYWQTTDPAYTYFGPLAVTHDGINGLIKDSVSSFITAYADAIVDTLCSQPTVPVNVHIASSLCAGVRIDSISVLRASGNIGKKITPTILSNNSVNFALTYSGKIVGSDSITLRVLFHSLEWGYKESIDVGTSAVNVVLPAVLDVPAKLDFGNVHVDSTKQLTLQITNSGCSSLRVDSIVSSNAALFAIAPQTFPFTIGHDTTKKLTVTFSPTSRSAAIESIELGTSAGHKFIELSGNGVTEPQKGVRTAEANECKLWPNPASDVLYISGSDGAAVTIRDELGRSEYIGTSTSDLDLIPLSRFSIGMYFVTIDNRIYRILIAR